MPGLCKYWLLVTSSGFGIGKKETRMFNVSNIVKFCAFSELLWEYTVFIRYKLNRLWTSRVNQFDIFALLFGGYARFIPLD